MERRNVGILGATGAVGQRFIQLLADHPWFNITWLAASDRSAGKTYSEACAWRLDTPLPERIAQMVLQPNTPEAAGAYLPRIIFSSVDSPIAKELEPRFAAAGCAVISNSSAFRMAPDVPLVVPEVNADHFEVIESQPTRKQSGGFLVTNPNCCAIGLCCRWRRWSRPSASRSYLSRRCRRFRVLAILAWLRSTSSAT